MSNTLSTLAAVVKEMYPSDAVGDTLLDGCALYAEMPKDWNCSGEPIRMATKYASGGGSASEFAAAQATIGNVAWSRWQLTTVEEYSLFRMSGKSLRATKGNKGALVDTVQEVGDTALERLRRNMHRGLYGNGGGALAQIGSGSASTTLTLATIDDIVHFSPGDVIESSATDGTSGAGDAEYIEIVGVDEDLGTITKAGANWNASGNFAANDYLFFRGTFGLKVSGLDAWVPPTAPGATSFFGVDRTASVTRLGGIRYTADVALDQTIEGALKRASARAKRGGARPSHVFMHPVDLAQLELELSDRVRFEKVFPTNAKNQKIQGHIGFDAMVIATAAGAVKCMADELCPRGVAYMLDMSSWKVVGYGEPGWLKHDDAEILRQADGDAIEGRMGCYWQLGCKAPGHNVRIDLSAVLQS